MSTQELTPCKTILPLATRTKICWLGPDGGARIGRLVSHADDGAVVAVDLHRQEVAILMPGEYKANTPKDDEGNAK